MTLAPGTQLVCTLWRPQQFTVTGVDKDCRVSVRSNVQPLSTVLYPGDYRVGVTLAKLPDRLSSAR